MAFTYPPGAANTPTHVSELHPHGLPLGMAQGLQGAEGEARLVAEGQGGRQRGDGGGPAGAHDGLRPPRQGPRLSTEGGGSSRQRQEAEVAVVNVARTALLEQESVDRDHAFHCCWHWHFSVATYADLLLMDWTFSCPGGKMGS